jgi:hypothetical protein
MEDLEINNEKELIKQRDEYLRKNGNYMEVGIIIPKDKKEPVFTNVAINGVGYEEIAKMIVSLRATIDCLENKFPVAAAMSKFMAVDTEEQELKKGR